MLRRAAVSTTARVISERTAPVMRSLGADTASAAGRVRAFELVREILSRASSPKEREEEVRTVADRLRLSPENVDLLLRTEPEGDKGTGKARSRAGDSSVRVVPAYRERVRSPEATVEREFLLAVISNPGEAEPILGAVTPEYFVDPLHREAFVGLKDALLDEQSNEAMRRLVRQDSDLGRLYVRLALESHQAGLYIGIPVCILQSSA